MRRSSFLGILAIIGTTALLSACASTTVTAVWRDDAYAGMPHKALVILVSDQPVIMRVFEDDFARQLKARGVEAVPGYSLLPMDRKLDKDEIAAATEKMNADTLFMTRLVDKQSYETYYPGSVYASHAGPPGYGWRDSYARGYTSYQATPGYTVQQNILYIETQLYDVKTGNLIWSVMTKTVVEDFKESEVRAFVKVIMKNLTKKGLLPNP